MQYSYLQIHLESGEQNLLFPLPSNAKSITVNGKPARTTHSGDLRNIKLSSISVLTKIVLIPAAMLTLSSFLGFDKLAMAILIAIFATPNAVSSYAMARSYEADRELAGEIITLGTLLSIVTIFVFVTISKSCGWI